MDLRSLSNPLQLLKLACQAQLQVLSRLEDIHLSSSFPQASQPFTFPPPGYTTSRDSQAAAWNTIGPAQQNLLTQLMLSVLMQAPSSHMQQASSDPVEHGDVPIAAQPRAAQRTVDAVNNPHQQRPQNNTSATRFEYAPRNNTGANFSLTMVIPKNRVGRIIGRKGFTISRIRRHHKLSKLYIAKDKATGERFAFVQGTEIGVHHAIETINQLLSDRNHSPIFGSPEYTGNAAAASNTHSNPSPASGSPISSAPAAASPPTAPPTAAPPPSPAIPELPQTGPTPVAPPPSPASPELPQTGPTPVVPLHSPASPEQSQTGPTSVAPPPSPASPELPQTGPTPVAPPPSPAT